VRGLFDEHSNLGGPGGEHPVRRQHDSHLTDLMVCCTGPRLARRPHVDRMRDGRSSLGDMEDVMYLPPEVYLMVA